MAPTPVETSAILVQHLHALRYEDLPVEVIQQAKRCLLDYLGVALAGSTTETAAKVQSLLDHLEGEQRITAIGHRRKTDLLKAALANGITAHALELDDGERRASVHAGSAVLSALLPLLEKETVDGRSLITGIVAGYETAIRIGRTVQPSHRGRGFHATATCGTMGAAMAAAKALNLSKEEMAHALGLAGTSAAGLLQFLDDGSEIKQFHPGKAALCGLLAVYVARSGFTASLDILEGKRAFFHAASDTHTPEECTATLGKAFAILDVYFKPYAACRHCHAPIEAVLALRETHALEADQVKRIGISTYKAAVDGHSDPCPRSVVGAKMSVPFSVAVALKTGWAGPKEFTSDAFENPVLIALSKLVDLKEDPALSALVPGKRPAIVDIETREGRRHALRVDLPKGEPENPMTEEEMKRKFSDLASTCRTPEQIAAIMEIVESAEDRISELTPLLI